MTSAQFNHRIARPANGRAFTLIELLVVLAIIGIILALSLPSFRGMNEGRTMEGATRQLLQDLAYARQTAIATRSTVAVVFIPPDVVNWDPFSPIFDGQERTNVMRLQSGQLTSYALFAYRQAGEQPGQSSRRYLTEWRTLPEKVFIAESAFTNGAPNGPFICTFKANGARDFGKSAPYPLARSVFEAMLPYIAFDAQGRCVPLTDKLNGTTYPAKATDIFLPLASGTIMHTRNPDGSLADWSVQEIPPNNSVNTSNVIRIDWLTGRAKLFRADMTPQ